MLHFSKRSFDQFHLVGLAMALVLLITVACLSYAGWQEYDQAMQGTREINSLIRTAQSVALDLERAEVADQRFLLTGDQAFRSAYLSS
ncbi:MAG TPA: hypothetical protein VG322_01550, partial [Candidatus Acidoferrales bacterium]|nr:hypothetical protein [Candidatus Acidoferrales bacterium]